MASIYDSLKKRIFPSVATQVAASLGENEGAVCRAAAAILPSLLGRLIGQQGSADVRNLVGEAGKPDGLSGGNTPEDDKPGLRLCRLLLGADRDAFLSEVAEKYGIGQDGAELLTVRIAAEIAGFLNGQTGNGETLGDLLNELESEKKSIQVDIPSDLYSLLGLSSVFTYRPPVVEYADAPERRKYGWINWIVILAVLVLLFLWVRSCNAKGERPESSASLPVQAGHRSDTAPETGEAVFPDPPVPA